MIRDDAANRSSGFLPAPDLLPRVEERSSIDARRISIRAETQRLKDARSACPCQILFVPREISPPIVSEFKSRVFVCALLQGPRSWSTDCKLVGLFSPIHRAQTHRGVVRSWITLPAWPVRPLVIISMTNKAFYARPDNSSRPRRWNVARC